MNYALVEAGNVISIGLPQTGILKDGSTVSGYDLLDAETLLEEGWLPLVDVTPAYNLETETIIHEGYTVEDGTVTSNYTVIPKVITPYVPTLEERLAATEQALLAIMEVL